MNIGILGSGQMGGAFAKLWAQKGHNILITSNNLEQTRELAASIGESVCVGIVEEVVKFGDAIVFAVPYSALSDVTRSKDLYSGKVIIDVVNPLTPDAMDLLIGHATSAAEELAGLIPGAKIVKAFNTISARVLQSGDFMFNNVPANVFYCGDDTGAKTVVRRLIEEIGFEAIDAGQLTCSRFLEPMAEFVIQLAVAGLGDNINLNVMRRG
jgi:predicted dinucleotide-binding enzyme